jgi:hypothetical protein
VTVTIENDDGIPRWHDGCVGEHRLGARKTLVPVRRISGHTDRQPAPTQDTLKSEARSDAVTVRALRPGEQHGAALTEPSQ